METIYESDFYKVPNDDDKQPVKNDFTTGKLSHFEFMALQEFESIRYRIDHLAWYLSVITICQIFSCLHTVYK